MKRFAWPLERLLTVTHQRERALRATMASLAREIVVLRRDIARRQAIMRMVLADMAQRTIEDRMARQEVFMRSMAVAQKHLNTVLDRLTQTLNRRDEAMAAFLQVRAKRQTLERLREEARWQHQTAQSAAEQKLLDETAQVAHVRREMAVSRSMA